MDDLTSSVRDWLKKWTVEYLLGGHEDLRITLTILKNICLKEKIL